MSNPPDAINGQINRWHVRTNSAKTLVCVERILHAMEASAFSNIRDSRLQVAAMAQGMIWAYFPMYERRWITRQLSYPIERGVKVLLVVGEDTVESQPRRTTMAELAHHFGHALCYLRKPGWIHDCPDADRAARKAGLKKFVRTPQEIYGCRKRGRDFDLSEATIRRKPQRLEELNSSSVSRSKRARPTGTIDRRLGAITMASE